jgi:hypothetical protein
VTPLRVFSPYLLIISRNLSSDSTDDEANNEFTMGSHKLQDFRHDKNPRIPMKNAPDKWRMAP